MDFFFNKRQGAEVGYFYHPAKEQTTLQLDADVVAWLQAQDD